MGIRVPSVAAIAAIVVSFAAIPTASAAELDRIGGDDRYETAVAISQRLIGDGERAPIAFVASGVDFPDALAGAAAAANLGGPVLLSRQDGLPEAVATELARIDPEQVIVLGGTAALSTQVEADIAANVAGTVTRLAGTDRYETAALVADFAFDSGVPVVFIASGASFPDALAGAAAAGSLGGPVLLTKPSAVPAATSSRVTALAPETVILLGGEAVVGPDTQQIHDGAAIRIGGADRYATAAGVANYLDQRGGGAYLASGVSFPDALAGAALAGYEGSPVLLVRPDSVPDVVALQLRLQDPERITVLGGESAVSAEAANNAATVNPLPVDRLSQWSVAQEGVEAAQLGDVDRLTQVSTSRADAEEVIVMFGFYSIAGPYRVSSCAVDGGGHHCQVASASFLYCDVGSLELTRSPSGQFSVSSYTPYLSCYD